MSLIDNLTKDIGGLINQEVNKTVYKLESKLENAVGDLFKSVLGTSGIGGLVAGRLTSAFNDAIESAKADKYFGTLTAEANRASQKDIENNSIEPKYLETSVRAVERASMGASTAGVDYKYPEQDIPHWMDFVFTKYQRSSPESRPKLKPLFTIRLPIPHNLVEEHNVNISPTPAGLAGAVLDYFQDTEAPGGASGEQDAGFINQQILAQIVNKIGEMSSGVGTDVTQSIGAIPNPYLTLVFQGVNLRSFSFDWKFSPRNPSESAAVKQIVKMFKTASLPSIDPSSGSAMLNYPLMCSPAIYINSEPSDLIKFKTMLINSVNFNYAPNGIPSFFTGTKEPTFIQMSVNLTEMDYFVANDYNKDPEHPTDLEKSISDNQKVKGLLTDINKIENSNPAFKTFRGLAANTVTDIRTALQKKDGQ